MSAESTHINSPREIPVSSAKLSDFPHNPIACLQQVHEECGEIAAIEEDGSKIVCVFEPKLIQQVLTDSQRFHSHFFALRGAKKSAQRRLTNGLLTMNGGDHRQHRRMVKKPFALPSIPAYDEITERLVSEMLDDWKVGEVRDLDAEMTTLMRRLTSAVLFGMDYPDLSEEIGHATDRWVRLNHDTGMAAYVSGSFSDQYEELLQLASDLEERIRDLLQKRRHSGELGQDVLSILMQAHGRDGAIDDSQLIGHITLLFGAAHLTTAHTLIWTLFQLAQSPFIMSELYDELTEETECSWDDKSSLGYRVLRESMRSLPASAYLQRFCSEPVDLGPYHLPTGTGVLFSQFMTHHRSEIYDSPFEFRPERWNDISPTPYEYFPFGAGPRMCIGAPMAMRSMGSILPKILRTFRLSVVPNVDINANVISTMLAPTTPVPVEIHAPDKQFSASSISGSILDLVHLPEMPATDGLRRAA
ncbi:MAG: cytochrome P450 [Planctomycetaceae bacterium]|jgi:cytochrome P450|nr:cytochrome P450 [Planctomycetaceae bacterium]